MRFEVKTFALWLQIIFVVAVLHTGYGAEKAEPFAIRYDKKTGNSVLYLFFLVSVLDLSSAHYSTLETTDWEYMKKKCHNVVYEYEGRQVKFGMLSINNYKEYLFFGKMIRLYNRIHGVSKTDQVPEILLGAATHNKWMDRSDTWLIDPRIGPFNGYPLESIKPGFCLYYRDYDGLVVKTCKGPQDFIFEHGIIICKGTTKERFSADKYGLKFPPDDVRRRTGHLTTRVPLTRTRYRNVTTEAPKKRRAKKARKTRTKRVTRPTTQPRRLRTAPPELLNRMNSPRRATAAKRQASKVGMSSLKAPPHLLLLTSIVEVVLVAAVAV